MQNNVNSVEKTISVLSYLTMGIVGLLWIIVAYFVKKKIRFFLMYNIVQSMLISITLSFLGLLFDLFCSIFGNIKFLSPFIELLITLFVKKVVFIFGLSFSLPEVFIFILFAYIISGICIGRIFKIPFLTNLMKKLTANY